MIMAVISRDLVLFCWETIVSRHFAPPMLESILTRRP
jgi:hypothetical protein